MKAEVNGSGGPDGTTKAPAASRSQTRPGLGEVLASAMDLVDELATSAWQQVEIYADQRRLGVQRKIVKAAIAVVLGIGLIVWLSAAVAAMVRGLCEALAVVFGGRVWLGDLVGGALALVGAVGALFLAKHLMTRRELQRLEAKYGRLPETPSADARGAARTEGSPGPSQDADRDAALP